MKNPNKSSILRIIKREMPYLHETFGVEWLALYGSFARGNPNEDSDIDIVVSLLKPLGFSFIHLADYLEQKLNRKVDLVTSSSLEMGKIDTRREHIIKDIQESLIYV